MADDDLDAKLKRLEERIARERKRLHAMTEQERMDIGDFLESVSDRFEEDEGRDPPKDPGRVER